MNAQPEHQKISLAAAWQQFISTGELQRDLHRPEIIDSWLRCREMDVDPYDGVSHQLLNADEISTLLETKRTYVTLVRHFMKQLYEFVRGSGFIVFLANQNGCILEAMGDPETLKSAAQVNMIQGASWCEDAGGTNGIGTALALGRPIQVSGYEHYCQKLHQWTCSAAPLFTEAGEISGVLQMSGPSYESHPHTLGMVVAAAEAINKHLSLWHSNQELTVANVQLNLLFQTMSDGALIVDADGIVLQTNPSAKEVFGKDLVGVPINTIIAHFDELDLLHKPHSCKDIDVVLLTMTGAVEAMLTAKSIRNESSGESEVVVFFNPIHKMKKIANRFGGAQATFHFSDILGEHASLQEAIRVGHKAAKNLSHVLIQGESGTGKDLLAQAIHNASSRRNGPFLALNCAALPRDLIASELFGYISGAFTGASPKGRPGKFEMASGGTLLLDEIGDMPLDQQATLLRVLQDKQVNRLGSERVISVDVRVICATHRDLLDAVHRGHFRQDLFYRINVAQIVVPPLRKRGDDVIVLFNHLLQKISRRLLVAQPQVDPEVLDTLRRYHWPGNVRELENVVEKMIHAADGTTLSIDHLPAEIIATPESKPQPQGGEQAQHSSTFKQALGEQERQLMLELLQRYDGNVSRIAREMAVSRNTVYRKMQTHGIARDLHFN